jgi:beta-glucanase (GH16 family)
MRAKFLGILTAAVIVFAGLVAPNLSNAAPPTATSHPITFDANGGSGVMNKQIISIKGKKLSPNKFVRDTHRFIGWSLTRTGSVKYYNTSVLKPNRKITLYAQWKVTATTPMLAGHTVGKLLWSDSFTGKAGGLIDSKSWTSRYCGHEADNGGGTCHNNEKQWYIPEAIRLDGTSQGNAVITSKYVGNTPPANSGSCKSDPCNFTSGRFDTQKKVSFKYGYIEARMKMPTGGGNWPAFWALGDAMSEVSWPRAGEIDIAEQGGDRPVRNSAAVHFSVTEFGGGHRYIMGEKIGQANYQTSFHTYGLAWLENRMEFYVDRQLFWTVTPTNVNGYWAFNKPFFLILNNAVQGSAGFGGNYDGWAESKTIIDYVHAWQLNGQGSVVKSK